jgi:tRNA(Ile)-lysidine synthase
VSDDLLQRTATAIRQHQLFAPGQKIMVAVSGGADSMVLLHLLNSLAPKNNWRLSVAHFNHQLRGRASKADEHLVRRTAKKLHLPFFVGRADVMSVATRSKISIEMAARHLRHAFFARAARRHKIRTLALAHHADDQVELFFLRLLRGTGGTGIAGMVSLGTSAADSNLSLARPLLGFGKSDLVGFAESVGITFREDKSNRSSDHLRNRIRNELMPLLKEHYQPGLNAALLRLMEIIGAESAVAEDLARKWLENNRALGRTRSAKRFSSLNIAVQRKVLQQQLIKLGIIPDFGLVEALRESVEKWTSVSLGLSIARDLTGMLSLRRSNPLHFKANELKLTLSNRAGGATFAGRKFRWSIKKSLGFKGFLPPQSMTEFFDADKIGSKIILRHWRAGDRFQPIGMPSPVKLQDLFVNLKIPAARRRELVLATNQKGDIFWVESLRIADPFKLTPGTRRQLSWQWSSVA